MGELITLEDWVTIRNLHAKGYGKKTIAKLLGISKNTVKSALKKDTHPKYRRTVTFENKLIAPYVETIETMFFHQAV